MKHMVGAVLLVLALAAPAWAAGPPGRCDPEVAIAQAEQVLEVARDAVGRSPVREASELLLAARDRLGDAGGLNRRGQGARACMMAQVSIKLSERAVELARRGDRSLAELENILDRTDEFLRDAADDVGASNSAQARRLLRAAAEQEKEARGAFRSGHPRIALKLTLMARDAADRARRVSTGGEAVRAGDLEKFLGETDRLLEEARGVVAGDNSAGGAGEILDRAGKMQGEARRHLQGGRPALALELSRQARFLGLRALGNVDVAPDAKDVETLAASTSELLDRLRAEAQGAGDDGARSLLAKASRLLDEARADLASGETREALGAVRAASALALDVSARLRPGARD